MVPLYLSTVNTGTFLIPSKPYGCLKVTYPGWDGMHLTIIKSAAESRDLRAVHGAALWIQYRKHMPTKLWAEENRE